MDRHLGLRDAIAMTLMSLDFQVHFPETPDAGGDLFVTHRAVRGELPVVIKSSSVGVRDLGPSHALLGLPHLTGQALAHAQAAGRTSGRRIGG